MNQLEVSGSNIEISENIELLEYNSPICRSPSEDQQSEDQQLGALIQAVYAKSLPEISPERDDSLMAGLLGANSLLLGREAVANLPTFSWLNGPDITSHVSGLTTGINAVGNVLQIPENLHQIAYAKLIGDRRALYVGLLSLVANGLVIGSAASIGGGFRIASILSLIQGGVTTGFTAPSLLGRVTHGFLFVGFFLLSIWNVVASAIAGIHMYEGHKLKQALKNCKTPEEQMAFLQKKLGMELNEWKLLEKLKAQNPEGYKDMLKKEGEEAVKTSFSRLLKELHISLEKKELEKILFLILEDPLFESQKLAPLEGEELTGLQQIGLALKLEQKIRKKEDKLMRILKDKGLIEEIRSGHSDPALIETMVGNLRKKVNQMICFKAVSIAVFGLSMGAIITSMVFTGGVGLLVGAILMGISCLALLLLDSYSFNKSLKSDQPTPYTKKQVIISVIATIATTAAILALQVIGVISLGVVPLALTLVMTGCWLLYHAYLWHLLSHHEDHISKNLSVYRREAQRNSQEVEPLSFAIKA